MLHVDVVGGQLDDHAVLLADDDVTGILRGARLHPGADQWRLAHQQRHRLALHVRAHQGAVGVVVLQERDHRGRDRDHLARRDVHVVDLAGRDELHLAALAAHQDSALRERAVVRQRRVRLGDDVAVLLVGGQVVDLVGDPALDDLAVGRLHEPERVHPAERGQRPDQADVRAFRRLDRAHPAVVAGVHVADLEAGPLPRQAAGAQRGQPPLVGEPGQRVRLVHELRELGRPEELLDARDHRTDVDERLRRDRLDVLRRHPLADDALHPGQAQPHLVLDQLTDRAQPPVAEVVDVVDLEAGVTALVQPHHVVDGGDDVVLGEDARRVGDVEPELLVDLVAADLRQVVALGVEVVVLQQVLGVLGGGRLAGAQLAEDVEQRLVLGGRVVLLQGRAHRLEVAEALEDLRVVPPQRLEQDGHVLAALAVEPHADGVALVDVELQPRAPARDDLGTEDVLVGRGLVLVAAEVDTGGADELRDDDPLGAVDDKGALRGHEGEVAHEHRLALDLAGVVVGELGRDEHRGRVGHVLVLALLDGVLRRLEPVVPERQGHRPRVVLDRRDLLEDLFQTGGDGDVVTTGVHGLLDPGLPGLVADEPIERLGL